MEGGSNFVNPYTKSPPRRVRVVLQAPPRGPGRHGPKPRESLVSREMVVEVPSAGEFADCEVTAAVKQAAQGRLVVQLPETAAFHRKTTLSLKLAKKLAKGVQGRLASSDLRRIKPGAKVVRLVAIQSQAASAIGCVDEDQFAREISAGASWRKLAGLGDVIFGQQRNGAETHEQDR